MGIGFVIFMALFIKCFAAHTPSRSALRVSVSDPDPGSGAFLTPGLESGIGFSRIPNLYFESLVTIFL
jgi:hypothetical protein